MAKGLTYREVVQNWKHYIADRSGFESRSNGWSDKALLEQFLLIRSTILKQLMVSGAEIGEQSIQNLPCVKLDEAPISTCPCAPASGCTWYRSINTIPKYLKLISINTIDGGEGFSFVEWDKIKYRTKYSRSKKATKNFYTIRTIDGESYLYIMSDRMLQLVSLTAIFEDPYCPIEFPKCAEEPTSTDLTKICNPWDTPFLMDSALISQVFTIAWQTLPQLRATAGPDMFNDMVDNTKGELNLKI